MSTCGCARCKREFTTLAAFDRHQDVDYSRRPAVQCKEPSSVGLAQNERGRWHEPQTPAGRARLANLRAERARGVVKPCCYDCLSEDVAVKVIDLCGFEHWFCAADWAVSEEFREKLLSFLGIAAEQPKAPAP